MKRILYALLFLIFAKSVLGQSSLPQNNLVSIPPPPEASSLFKFIETPVSQYTGIANISIPVYDIKLRGLSLPIALNYHSGGFKVDEQSSSVGIGWALQAGGVISSTVFGKPDFSSNGYVRYSDNSGIIIPETRALDPQFTWDGVSQSIPNADYSLLKKLTGNTQVTIDKTTGQLFGGNSTYSETPYDTQADLWYYSMFDQGGKFMFTRDGTPHTIPFNNYKIIRANQFNEVGGYTITDTHGNIYVFDQLESQQTDVITNAITLFASPESNTISYSYYLSKIYTLLGDTVSISYTPTHYKYKNQPSYTRYRPLPGQFNGISGDVLTNVVSTTEVYGLQISQIVTNRGHKVVFNYQSTARLDMPATVIPNQSINIPGLPALKSIDIYENNIVKTFGLVQEYLNQAYYNQLITPSPDALKLKLKQVTETGTGTYNLFYNNEYGSFPSRFDYGQDHWGYSNGAGNTSFFPPDPANGFYDGANRAPDANYCSAGVLNKIVYPTGGATTYDYESNMYPGTTPTTINAVGSVGLYYSTPDVSTTQTTTFTIGNGSAPNSLKVKYDCGSITSNPEFYATLTGPGTSMVFNGVNTNPGGDPLTLPNAGTYTLTVLENGAYDNGNAFIQIFWDQQTTIPGVSGNLPGGGLRIKTIKDYTSATAPTPSLTHNYAYNTLNTTTSSGHLYNQPLYTYLYDKVTYHPSKDNCERGDQHSTYLTQTAQSNLPLNSLGFGAIVYDEVQETQSDNNGNINGLTDNSYSVANDFKPYPAVYPFTPPTSYDFMRGNLLKSEIYKSAGGTLQLQKRITNTYNINYTTPNIVVNSSEMGADYTPATQPNETHIFNTNIVLLEPEYRVEGTACTAVYPALFQVESYKFISNWQYLSETDVEDYETGTTNPVVTSTLYNYDNPTHAQLTKTQVTNSDSKKYFSLITYPNDYASGTAFMSDLISSNNITTPIEKVSYEQLPDNSINVLSGSITDYLSGGRGQVNNVYGLVTNVPIPLSGYKFSNAVLGNLPNYTSPVGYSMDSHYQLKAGITNYDAKFNPSEVSVANGIKTGYKWAYPDLRPVAVCKNASSAEFYVENFENNTALGVITGAAHTGTKYFIGYHTVNWTRPNNRNYVISYWYSSATSPWQFKQDNYTGDSYLLTGGNAYDDICIYPSDAQITTYTYAPLIGMTSTTDASGKTTYYEYDTNKRLINTRDQNGNILKSYCYNYAGQNTGCNLTIPPPLPPTVYGRLEITNYTNAYDNSDPDDHNQTLHADVNVKLYSDAACTTPLVLNYNIDILLAETYSVFNGFNTTNPAPSTTSTLYTIVAGFSGFYLGNMLIGNTDTFYNTYLGTVTDTQSWTFSLSAMGAGNIETTLN